MPDTDEYISLSPAVVQVIDRFVTALRENSQVPGHAIDRLDAILRQGTVPKPDQLPEILFAPAEEKPDENEAAADAEGGES